LYSGFRFGIDILTSEKGVFQILVASDSLDVADLRLQQWLIYDAKHFPNLSTDPETTLPNNASGDNV